MLKDSWETGKRSIKEDFENFPLIRLSNYLTCDTIGQEHAVDIHYPQISLLFYVSHCKMRMNEIRNGSIKLEDINHSLSIELKKMNEEKKKEKAKKDVDVEDIYVPETLYTNAKVINPKKAELELDDSFVPRWAGRVRKQRYEPFKILETYEMDGRVYKITDDIEPLKTEQIFFPFDPTSWPTLRGESTKAKYIDDILQNGRHSNSISSNPGIPLDFSSLYPSIIPQNSRSYESIQSSIDKLFGLYQNIVIDRDKLRVYGNAINLSVDLDGDELGVACPVGVYSDTDSTAIKYHKIKYRNMNEQDVFPTNSDSFKPHTLKSQIPTKRERKINHRSRDRHTKIFQPRKNKMNYI